VLRPSGDSPICANCTLPSVEVHIPPCQRFPGTPTRWKILGIDTESDESGTLTVLDCVEKVSTEKEE
jgi:hypothetical protein